MLSSSFLTLNPSRTYTCVCVCAVQRLESTGGSAGYSTVPPSGSAEGGEGVQAAHPPDRRDIHVSSGEQEAGTHKYPAERTAQQGTYT